MNRKVWVAALAACVWIFCAGLIAAPVAEAQEASAAGAQQKSAEKKTDASGKRTLTIDDTFAIKNVGDAQISPDEKWVAYTVSTRPAREGQRAETVIWIAPMGGGEHLPMTLKTFASSNPRWSPDGKYLSFTSSRGEGAAAPAAAPAGGGGAGGAGAGPRSQVWLLDRRGGEAQQLTDIRQGVGSYEWSPDGTKLLLTLRDPDPEDRPAPEGGERQAQQRPRGPRPMVIDRLQFKQDRTGYLGNERRRTHIYVFDVASKKLTQITSGESDESSPEWSPDGKFVAFVSNRTPDPDTNFNSDIWIVAADNTDQGKTVMQVTTNPGPDRAPAWSPDGKTLAYVTAVDVKNFWYSTNHLAIISVPTGEPGGKVGTPQILTQKLDRNVSNPEFAADGKSIYFSLEDSGEQHLARIVLAGGEISRPLSGAISLSGFSIGKTGTIVVRYSQPHMTGELYMLEGAKPRQLTRVNEKLFAELRLADVEKIRFKSKDGTPVEGYLYKPVGYQAGLRYPTLLRIHGGPVAQYEASFNFESQLFAANGYAVVNVNPRGSSGYGQAFCQAIFADWGNKDSEDVLAGVDHVIAMGIADPDRLGVGGWSYGGILTNHVIVRTNRFKAAISGASQAMATAGYGHDQYQRHYEVELGLPWEKQNRALWDRVSAFWMVDRITTPTLWMCGDQDWNVPVQNSELMYQSMRRLGKAATQLVVYPGESHGITRPAFQKDRWERYLAWYAKYVKGEKQDTQQKAEEE
jgi:dipeptidyl aminopeptidase/acylaminoacyl peptidase